jgi:membrane fusion protein, multidrug efflux system
LTLHRTQLRAPVAGVIVKRSVEVGQRVAAGAPLMGLVPLDDVWVDANFKEVQLRYIRVGQPVSLHADLYGSHVEYHGKVAGLSAGSGSAFALLPAQNASGNWIKIVQRIPVRIVIDPQDLKDHPLRVGLSMSVEVNVQDASGPLVATQVRSTPLPTQASAGDDPDVEQRIRDIVVQNAGHTPQGSLARAVAVTGR